MTDSITNAEALRIIKKIKVLDKSLFNREASGSPRRSVILCVFLSVVGLASGCSFEKELPNGCVSEDKMVIRELCRNYGEKTTKNGKKATLFEHGFNTRDAEEFFLYSNEKSASCRVTVARQCDLIVMRNGVGY